MIGDRAAAPGAVRGSPSTLESQPRGVHFAWWVSGGVTVAAAVAFTGLSFSFVYGEGHAQRPILEFLCVWSLAWLAWLPLTRRSVQARGPGIGWVLGVALLARVILIPSQLILENDVYRYVLDGQVVLSGENPYRYSPRELTLLPYHPLKPALDDPEAQAVTQRIGYPEIPTVYPPLAQFSFAAGAWWGGWDWRGQRYLFLLCDLASLLLLWSLLRRLGHSVQTLALYAWNPLVLKEVANSAHVDILVVLALSAALWGMGAWAAIDESDRSSTASDSTGLQSRAFLLGAGGALACAVLSKLYPVVLLPAFCLFVYFRRGAKTMVTFGVATVAWIALGYAWFWEVGPDVLFAGLKTYSLEWRMNEGLFGLLSLVPVNPRLSALLLLAVFAQLTPLVGKARRLDQLSLQCVAVLLVWFLLLPAAFPWYALPLVALATLRPFHWASRGVWVLSGMIAAYYLSFYVEYHDLDRIWWHAVRLVEYAVILGSLAWFAFREAEFETQTEPGA